MIVLGFILLAVALLASLVGWVWLLVTAFSEGRYIWGILMIFLWPVVIIYGILNWREVKKPFLIYVSALPLLLMAYGVVFLGAAHRMGQLQLQARTQRATTATEPASPPASRPARPRPPRATPSTDLAQGSRPAAPPASPPAVPAEEPPKVAPPANAPTSPPPAEAPRSASPNAPAITNPPALKVPAEPAVRAEARVQVEFVGFLDDQGDILRNLKLRVVNQSDLEVRKLSMTFYYQDDQKRTLKEWTTEYEDPAGKPVAAARGKQEFKCPAFFMPDGTANVILRLRQVGFADGSVWKSRW